MAAARSAVAVVMLALWTQTLAAPQFITFSKDGELGVNFAGYHAGVGIGSKGLHAQAGTPFGQKAAAGLGGTVDDHGRSTGNLYAGATAGGNVRAAAGLGGTAGAEGSAGELYAGAQAGPKVAASGLQGETDASGASGYSYSGSKSVAISGGHAITKEVSPVAVDYDKDVIPLKPSHKKVHKEYESESVNYVTPVEPAPVIPVHKGIQITKHVEVQSNAQAPVVQEVYVPDSPPPVVYKRLHHRARPRHHYKHAYFLANAGAAPESSDGVYKTLPAIDKRIDVAPEGHADAGLSSNVGYRKTVQLSSNRSPTFFADIFNIPIQTLSAVGKFLGNAAGSTSVSVQKTASVHAGGHHDKYYY